MMTDKLFSLIIPVYNTPKDLFLGCLNSVVKQLGDYEDCECILVDDGSTDGSGDICDKYAEKYSIFRVYHKENQGNCYARNFGINKAVGQWILFLDCDDYVLDQYYYNISNAVALYGSRFKNICFNHKRLSHKDNDREYTSVKKNAHINEPRIYTVDNASFNACRVIWTHLYNRKLLIDNDINFPEKYTCKALHQYQDEDGYFNFLCFNYEELVLELPFFGIAHRIREGSTNQKQQQLSKLPSWHFLADLYDDIKNRYIQNERVISWIKAKAKVNNIILGAE